MFFSSLNTSGGGLPPTPPETYDFDIFINEGQSNMDDRNEEVDLPSYFPDGIVQGVNMWNKEVSQFDTWEIGVNNGSYVNNLNYWGLDWVAHYNIRQALGRDYLVIKHTKGGTAIEIGVNTNGCWNVDFDNIPDGEDKLLQELGTKIDTVTAYLDSLGKTYKFRGVLNHQSESDADGGTTAENNYYTNKINLIAYIRTKVGDANLPYFMGTISESSASYSSIINAAKAQIASEQANTHLIDLSDQPLQDSYHFSPTGAITAGERYAASVINVLGL